MGISFLTAKIVDFANSVLGLKGLPDAFKKLDTFLHKFNLTKRELEIVYYLKQTYTNQQIAEKLHLSIYTVETHRKNIMHKLQLNSPAALVKFMIEFNV